MSEATWRGRVCAWRVEQWAVCGDWTGSSKLVRKKITSLTPIIGSRVTSGRFGRARIRTVGQCRSVDSEQWRAAASHHAIRWTMWCVETRQRRTGRDQDVSGDGRGQVGRAWDVDFRQNYRTWRQTRQQLGWSWERLEPGAGIGEAECDVEKRTQNGVEQSSGEVVVNGPFTVD